MRSPRKKPGAKPWKRVPGVVQRVHRTATEWREILARFGASGQSKTKFCEQNAIARSTFILWERRLASGDDGSTPGSAGEWFVEVEDDGEAAGSCRVRHAAVAASDGKATASRGFTQQCGSESSSSKDGGSPSKTNLVRRPGPLTRLRAR